MSYGSAAYGQAPYAGEAPASSINLDAGTLHDVVHVVTASVFGTNNAGTLHLVVHLQSAYSPNDAGTLHDTLHLVTAVAPATIVAGTLHDVVHLLTATAPTYAGTLHDRVHLVSPATPLAYTIGGAYRTAVAYGPLTIAVAGVTIPNLALDVLARTDLTTIIATLDDTYDRTFQDQLNDVGSAHFTIDNDDTDLTAIVFDRLVRFSVQGVAAFTMLIEETHRQSIAQGEEHDENTKVQGRGHLAILEEAVVYPTRGCDALPIEEDRPFNWTSPVYDDSGWGYSTSIGRQDGTFAYWTGLPNGSWPDGSAEWIWAKVQDPSYPPLDQWSPEGPCYMRHNFTVPAGVYRIQVYFTADAKGSLYVDGAKILDTDNGAADPTEMRTGFVDVTPGTRLFAAEVINDPDPEGDMVQNPAGLLVAIYSVDNEGNIIALLDHTDSSWKIVEYPPFPPGMTPGQVLRIVIEEAQARGALTGVTLGFTDFTDSSGNAWPNVTDIATKVGTDLLTFIKELTVTYVDVWLPPSSLQLQAWNRGGRTNTRAVTLHAPTDVNDPATGNLLELAQLQTV